MLRQRKGVLLDGVGQELVRASLGGRRKTLSQWFGALGDAWVTATGGTTAITLANLFGTSYGFVTVEAFGADPTGVSNSSTAIQAALDSGAKRVFAFGTYLLNTMITIPKGVALIAPGAVFKPGANVDMIRLHGGAKLLCYPKIDVTSLGSWSSACILFDGSSESSSTTLFRIPDPTICEVECRGDTTGTGNGTAIYFKTVDDTINNQWIMGVWCWAKVQGFDKAVYMVKDGTHATRTFVNQNRIWLDGGSSYQTVVMESDYAGVPYGVDGNKIWFEMQARSSAAEHTAIPFIIAGQKNRFYGEIVDWVGGDTGTRKAFQFLAGTRANYLETSRLATTYIENLSTERSNKVYNDIDGQGPSYGQSARAATKVSVPASRTATGYDGDFAVDDNFLYAYESANDWKQFPAKNWQVLARSFASGNSITGTTSETTLATISVPANAMGANGVLRLTTYWTYTNNANTKTLRTKFGGTTIVNPAPTTTATSRHLIEIANRNATNSQIATENALATSSSFGAMGSAFQTAAIDTTSAQDIVFTAQLGNSADTITLEGYLIELSYSA